MKSECNSNFAGLYCALFIIVTVAQVATAQSTTRGMQTAPPRQTYDSQSPRVIDFTRTAPGNQAAAPRSSNNVIDFTKPRGNSINPQHNNSASGARQIPLQNMPFGDRVQPQANAPQIFGNVNQGAGDIASSGRNAVQKVNEAGKRFWQNAAKPFQKPQFNLPTNLNRKPNYTESQTLTDSNPLAGRFKLPAMEKPAWMQKLDGKAKSLIGRKNELQSSAAGFANRINGAQQNANQAWQGLTQPGAAPAAPSANNGWLDNLQGTIQR